jgi:hypothetical protein
MKTQIPFKELVHLLNGCESSIFELNDKFWHRLDRNAFFINLLEGCELEQIQRIGLIALQYNEIKRYLDQQFGM